MNACNEAALAAARLGAKEVCMEHFEKVRLCLRVADGVSTHTEFNTEPARNPLTLNP